MTLKIAIVGTGGVATHRYIPYLASLPDVELGLYNRTWEKANQAAQQFGAKVFASLAELAAWEPTAVLVLTSERVHYEIGIELLDLNVPRLCFEKPLVAQLGQGQVMEEDFVKGKALLDRARAQGCETAMAFNYRFFEQSLTAKKIVAERNFGKVTDVIALVHYACLSHCIDLIQYFSGSLAEITALSGTEERTSPQIGVVAPDITAAFRLENEATGTFIGTAGIKWHHPLYELIFVFEDGRIHMRDLDGDLEILSGNNQLHETLSLVRHTSRWDQHSDAFKKFLDAYLNSIRSGSPPPIPGIDGLRELQFEVALKRSIAQKRPVSVQEEFPLFTPT